MPRSIQSGDSGPLRARFASAGLRCYPSVHPGAPSAALTLAMLAPEHPTRRRCRVNLFVTADGEPEGRVAAIVNPRLVDADGHPYGLLALFECEDDPDLASALLDQACAWLSAQGCRVARGPMLYSTWHDYRFVVADRGDGWIPGEPVHQPFYPRLWTEAGFTVATRYGSYWMGEPEELIARFADRAAQGAAAGFTLRPPRAEDLPALHALSVEAFAGAWMYAPIERDEFTALYTPERIAQGADSSFVAVAPTGEPAGYMYNFELPLGGELAAVCKTIAVAPRFRDQKIYHLLMHAWYRAQAARGVRRFVGALMHAEGDPAKLGWCRPENALKEYAVHERRL
jgi:GNAT superfamily N-acetyltransferase